MRIQIIILLSLTLFILTSCEKEKEEVEEEDLTGVPILNMKTILTGYEIIWGMDFLPNGDLIFGEKRGKLYRKNDETVTEISGFPEVLFAGQGGLLDIMVHPDYSKNGWVYACYAASNPSGGGLLKLIRFKITDDQVQNIESIFNTNGSNTWYGHYGSRIVFDMDKYLYLSVGEGGVGSYGGPNTTNNNAQDRMSSWGKIHRLKDDGSIPADNPVIPGNSGPSSIFTYGHRNPQGLALHPGTGEIWASEQGPKGGDEVNILIRGANYGWPTYSIGVNYDGTAISSGHSATGINAPIHTWTPSIATCGIAFITSNNFKSWKGNLLVSGLVSQKLIRCVVNGDKLVEEDVLLSNSGRVRNVIQAPDGSIYVSVENPGRIIQILPE
ncbi:MAG: PQQ-dependent sugar dehydrogenase [Bacteroidales bacterium]|jgi:glucose/arabinose dehydrogenase|nr:PQQ-dependent sugar dehydrogenase [Bacteroidales bacterium]